MVGPELLATQTDTPLELDWTSVTVGWQRAYQVKLGLLKDPLAAEAAAEFVNKVLSGTTTDDRLLAQQDELRLYYTFE